ncbi:VIT1/CCC1 transporter family protein [Mycobacteroides abscessus]|uniref:VIT1/CCC1 transporter family protein n=1 Tax=Mycobacteroides abscessus TaxID=36809 RepID=UPI0005DE20A4|nr:VIT1/CCC1 transporter family protein [Mycobacteroides abscessus]CPW49553.1 Membrane protein [Mycobacteroides abscessus]SKF54057.1 Membrane protein [Mycobacteroides abscessus subsp. bolletii]SKH05626.1 Membrane protein [Mycobacteroides abscessus subsp. bolletii]
MAIDGSTGSAELPHEFDHTHPDVSGGWLRAATFGAMDGLVTNTALVAGVGASGLDAHAIVLTGAASLVAGAFSMALGEFTSVSTSNSQIEHEASVERRAIQLHPDAEKQELISMLGDIGLSPQTAAAAADEIHRDENTAVTIHLTRELGINPNETPSPWVAALSSFVTFSVGAVVPLIPFLLGFASLLAGLICGGVGLLIAGWVAGSFTSRPRWLSALRQLAFGVIAIGATYLIGHLIGVAVN